MSDVVNPHSGFVTGTAVGIFHALMRNVLSFANAHDNHYNAKVRNIAEISKYLTYFSKWHLPSRADVISIV